jgi:hypothetical protein
VGNELQMDCFMRIIENAIFMSLLTAFLYLGGSIGYAQDSENDVDEIMDDAGIPEEDPEEPDGGIEPAPPADDDSNRNSNNRNSNSDDGGPRPDPNYGKRRPNNSDEVDGEVIEGTEDEDIQKVTPRKEFTSAQVKKICNKYRGKYISYYSKVFKVLSCIRRPFVQHKSIVGLLNRGGSFVEVGSDVVAALPLGPPLDKEMVAATARSCKDLNGKYVTLSHVDIFYIEKCKKRKFPDFATYESHRGASRMDPIVDLSWYEFSRIKEGAPISSVLDKIFADLLSGDAGIDIIPVDEACEGINGRIVTYYSRVYKIQKCYKREYMSSEMFTKKLINVNRPEINSQVWLSLPSGEPIDNRPVKPPKASSIR